MYPYTKSELDAFVLLQTGIQVCHRSEDTQACSYRSLGIVFMGLGIAEVHQESIPQELSNVTVIASNHLNAGDLISTDHVPVVFGIELAGECGRIDEITKHHRELPSFRVGRCRREKCNLRRRLFLHSRLLCGLSRLRGDFLSTCRVASPDETLAFVLSDRVHVKDFLLQVVEVVVIEVKTSLEGTIGYPSLAFQEVDDLGEDFIEGHTCPSAVWASPLCEHKMTHFRYGGKSLLGGNHRSHEGRLSLP